MFKTLKRTGALEAIKHQKGSKLYSEITQLCQDVFDSLPPDAGSFGGNVEAAANTMLKLKFGDHLTDIVRRNTGLLIDKVHIGDAYSPNAWMMCYPRHLDLFGPNAQDEDAYDLMWLRMRKDGLYRELGGWVTLHSVTESSDLLYQKLSDVYDSDKGIILDEKVAKDLSVETQLEACWFVISNYHKNIDPITAPIIAAVIMHEIGHAITDVELFYKMWRGALVVKDVLEYQNEQIDADNAKACLEDSLKTLGKTPNKTWEVKEMMRTIQATIKKIESGEMSLSEADALTFVKFLCKTSVGLILSYYQYDSLSKTSDQADTMTSHTATERGADEFSVRHGAAGALADSMRILYTIGESEPIGISENASALGKIIVSTFNALMCFQSVMNISACEITSSYDPIIERMRQMAQNSIAGLKSDKTLDKEFRDQYIKASMDALESLKKYKDQRYVRARMALYKFCSATFRLVGAPLLIFINNQMKENQALQEITSNFLRNEIHLHRARIDKIVNG